MEKIKLPNVTLVAVSSIKLADTEKALEESQKGIEYHAVKFISDQNIKSSDEYSEFVLYKLCNFIDSDFALVVQHDGYVLHSEKWDDEFLKYDYIGAPWTPNTYFTNDGAEVRVGNGGFSFRSKKLLNAFNALGLPFADNGTGFFHEDGQICSYYRKELEAYGIKFAPVEVASRFSREALLKDSVFLPFGFHNKRNITKTIWLRMFLAKIGISI